MGLIYWGINEGTMLLYMLILMHITGIFILFIRSIYGRNVLFVLLKKILIFWNILRIYFCLKKKPKFYKLIKIA